MLQYEQPFPVQREGEGRARPGEDPIRFLEGLESELPSPVGSVEQLLEGIVPPHAILVQILAPEQSVPRAE